MKRNIRRLMRQSKRQLINYHQGDLSNIVLIATIRGGSTVVADMLAGQKGTWFASEPFSPRRKTHMGQQLQVLSKEQSRRDCRFFNLNDEQHNEIYQYLKKLNAAALPTGTSRHTYFPLRASRVSLKVLRASWLTDIFAEQGMQVLFLIRHPAAQALSVMRLGWEYSAEIYFEKPDFLQHYFSNEQINYGLSILAEDNAFQKAVLSWVCDVIYPLRYSKHVSCQLFYEHLVSEPTLWIRHLCEKLQLSDHKIMEQLLAQPSSSSRYCTDNTTQAINSGNSAFLLKNWCGQLSEADLRAGQQVLDCFDINCYSMYDIMPLSLP